MEYATADDTAKAGEDYTATSGALAFEPGERKRTVSVPVLDDPHDEGGPPLWRTPAGDSASSARWILDSVGTGAALGWFSGALIAAMGRTECRRCAGGWSDLPDEGGIRVP